MLRLLLLLICLVPAVAQVLLIEGESAFVVPPSTTVDLRVVLSSSSLGGNVSGVNVHFIARQGSFQNEANFVVATDAAGRAMARFTTPAEAGYFSVDAAAELGDGAIVSFAFTVGSAVAPSPVEAIRADTRRNLLRNAADGSNLQLIGPWLLPAGTEIRPARWAKDKEAGGLWRTEEASWFFWVDDGPARSWAKPTRYYRMPVAAPERVEIAGEEWWPLVKVPGREWVSLGRTTSYLGNLIQIPDTGSGSECGLLLGNEGQPGAAQTLTAMRDYLRTRGVARFTSDVARLGGCLRTHVVIAAAGNADGVYLDRWWGWEELAQVLPNSGEVISLIESNQSGSAAYWWSGWNRDARVVSSADEERIAYVHPLRGGYLRRGLLPSLARTNDNLEAAVADTLRGELAVSSARPKYQWLSPGGPRRLGLAGVEFAGPNALQFKPVPANLEGPSLSVADAEVASASVVGQAIQVRGNKVGRTEVMLNALRGGQPVNGRFAVRVGRGAATVRACLIVAGQTECIGQFQREIPVAEDEVGGHSFIQVKDETIAAIDSKKYTYNRGERNIPLRVRGVKAGRTSLSFRSHDGKILGDVPVQVAALPPAIAGTNPTACPAAATFRATFEVSGGDQTLFESFGGAWWGNGITLVFRQMAAGQFEIRSSGTPEGQFFAMGGSLTADCSFIGSGQGVAGLRVTTAQVRGRISARNGIYDLMSLDYSIGVDGVFPRPIDYRGSGTLTAGCSYQVSVPEPLTASGGIYPVAIASPALCPWTAQVRSGQAAIVAGQIGFGPGVLWLEIPANTGPGREIVLDVAGIPLPLSQPANPPDRSLVYAVMNPATGGNLFAPGSPAIALGENLNLLRTIFRFGPYVIFLTPETVGPAEVGGYPIQVERVVPGILRVEPGSVDATGLDPQLPIHVAVEGRERQVERWESLGSGVHRLHLIGPPLQSGQVVEIRQGGRSAQRGALVM